MKTLKVQWQQEAPVSVPLQVLNISVPEPDAATVQVEQRPRTKLIVITKSGAVLQCCACG